MITQMSVRGLFSFAPGALAVDLGPLTVLIGANGTGKSNFIEALSILRDAPSALLWTSGEIGGNRW